MFAAVMSPNNRLGLITGAVAPTPLSTKPPISVWLLEMLRMRRVLPAGSAVIEAVVLSAKKSVTPAGAAVLEEREITEPEPEPTNELVSGEMGEAVIKPRAGS